MTKTVLRHEGVGKASLSVVFVTRQKIKALNKKFLRRDYATDVLAFDLKEWNGPGRRRAPVWEKGKHMIGDIIVSTDAAIQNAKIYKTPLSQEIVLYVIHGILHLLGFDDRKPRDARKMRRKEQELLGYLGAKTKKVIC